MGKGDRKTKKGKRWRKSTGNSRPSKRKARAAAKKAAPKKAAAKKAAPKKAAAKKAAPKKAAAKKAAPKKAAAKPAAVAPPQVDIPPAEGSAPPAQE
jgi:ribosomal small subunit protein bTHX